MPISHTLGTIYVLQAVNVLFDMFPSDKLSTNGEQYCNTGSTQQQVEEQPLISFALYLAKGSSNRTGMFAGSMCQYGKIQWQYKSYSTCQEHPTPRQELPNGISLVQ
jgi:hypothetical protein